MGLSNFGGHVQHLCTSLCNMMVKGNKKGSLLLDQVKRINGKMEIVILFQVVITSSLPI